MDIKTFAALATTIFFWSSAFVGIRIGLHDYSPGALALLRYLTASIAIIPVYFSLKNRVTLRSKDLFAFLIVGASGFTIYNIALNHGEVTVPAGIASFIVGLIPVFTMLLAITFLNERVHARGWVGVSISFLGVVLIAVGEHAGIKFDMGVLYNLIAAIAASIYAVMQKPLLKRYPPLQVGAIAIWIGTILLLFYTKDLYLQIKSASADATIAAIYMGIFPGVTAYMAWSYALSRVPACQASTAIYTMPIVTTFMAYLYLN
ncbi:MAG: DMT family transporter, partial [Coxiellaceae bacterium]|nr:DMT family transporter [Coxiellaceae bacterium]